MCFAYFQVCLKVVKKDKVCIYDLQSLLNSSSLLGHNIGFDSFMSLESERCHEQIYEPEFIMFISSCL